MDRRRRRTRVALPWVLSLAVHVGLIAWWASLPDPPPRVVQPELELRTIELVELPRPREPEPAQNEAEPSEPESSEPESSAPESSDPVPTESPSSPAEPATPERVPSSAAGRPVAPSEPSAPSEPDTSAPSGEGGIALLGLRGASRSSSATPSLRPSLPRAPVGGHEVVQEVGAARPPAAALRDGKPRSLEEAGFRTKRNGKQVFRDATGRFTATLGADGRVKFKNMPVGVSRDPLTGGARGLSMPGLAEGLRAASGVELYQQEKQRLLEETFDLRLQLAIGFARDKVDRRLKSLYRELIDDWGETSKSEAERRRALFRRWDECEEGLPVSLPGFAGAASSELDELRRDAGDQARETIERFIQRQLPQGSPQAFTEEELRRFNAGRRSRGRFAPYR